jgi:hypothetical protein
MLGRLKMSMSQAIASYNQLMSTVFSDKKRLTIGGSGAFKVTTLERGLKDIVREVTQDEDEMLLESTTEVTKCNVSVALPHGRNICKANDNSYQDLC